MRSGGNVLMFVSVFLTIVCVSIPALGKAVLVEAESFSRPGGWVLDQQFMQTMGSAYLLAHGLGEPVADAVTEVTFPAPGRYRLWVRTKNWVEGDWEAPGRFRVVIDGRPVETVFGTEPGWAWQDGGEVEIPRRQVELRLKDLTGFDGRCDALYFDSDPRGRGHDFDPAHPEQDRRWRNKLLGLPLVPPDGGRFDAIIVGGGIAGCAAALAASEQGLKVALINDRMALGGNASSEIRVHTLGIYGPGEHILKKIDTEHYPNGSPEALVDQQKREDAMTGAWGVTLFRPYRAYDVQTRGNRIVSVDACSTRTGRSVRLYSDVFIDCTGDGWIGYWAGADYAYGREGKDQYQEGWDKHEDLWSPQRPDNRVMGSSLLWYSIETEAPVTFGPVPWAMDIAQDRANVAGEWFWEYSDNDLHQIDDAETIRDVMLRAIYGSFANAKKDPKNARRKLDWVGWLLGKRESRRLLGDYIYTFKDAAEGRRFEDTVVEETRAIDVHYQLKETGSPYVFLSEALFYNVPRYTIPFRCLYSRNIANLMMAGRCFSCSHIGLGGPRVMRTTGQMGVATGYAASLCVRYQTTPRGVYQDHLDELKQLVYRFVPSPADNPQ